MSSGPIHAYEQKDSTMLDLVSILIPVYNAEPWLAQTLACATGQTWPRKEIIVVDDGSTDDSLQIARQHASTSEEANVKVICQDNQGGCAARNRALRAARGAYVQYLDADDLMDRNKIEVQMRRLAAKPPGTVASCTWERFHGDPDAPAPKDLFFRDRLIYADRDEGMDWAIDSVSDVGMFPLHAWLVPRAVAEAAGLWSESLLINQDGEYFNRVALASAGLAFCEDARVYYRSGLETSVSQQRSADVLISKHHSIELITDQILRQEDSERTRRACAYAFRAFAYEAYPEVPQHVQQALQQAKQLGGAPGFRPEGSDLYQYVHGLVGWKVAKRFRRWYYRLWHNRII